MFEHADVMVGFRTYPHVDMAETGYRSAKALEALMDRPEGWHKAMRQGDYLIPIAWQCTDDEPAKSLYGMTVGLPDNVLTASLFMGFPPPISPNAGLRSLLMAGAGTLSKPVPIPLWRH